jgi:hypothetical protein
MLFIILCLDLCFDPYLSNIREIPIRKSFPPHKTSEYYSRRSHNIYLRHPHLLRSTCLIPIHVHTSFRRRTRAHVDDPRLITRALDRLSDWLDRANMEGRAALEALRSTSIAANNLVGVLHQVADETTSGSGIKVTIAINRADTLFSLP